MTNRTRKLILCFLVLVVAVAAIILILDKDKNVFPARLKEPAAATVTFKVNPDSLLSLAAGQQPDEQTEELVRAAAVVINELSVRTTCEKSTSFTELFLKGEPLTSLAVRTDSEGFLVAAGVLKDTLLKLPLEEDVDLSSLSLSAEDLEKLEAAANQRLEALEAQLKEKLGAEEKGEWTFEEKAFTVRRPVEMTPKEAVTLLYTFARDLLADEAAAPLAAAFGNGFTAEDMDRSIQALQETPDEQLPSFSAFSYTAGRDVYTDVTITDRSGTELSCAWGTVGENNVLRLAVPGVADLVLRSKKDGSSFDLAARFMETSGTMELNASGTADKDGGQAGTAALTFDGSELLTLAWTLSSGEAVPDLFADEGKTVLTVENLKNFGRTEDTKALSVQLTSGLISLMQDASRIMPEEINRLMTLLIRSGF